MLQSFFFLFSFSPLCLPLFSIHWKKKFTHGEYANEAASYYDANEIPQQNELLRPRAQAYFIHIQKTLVCVRVCLHFLCVTMRVCVCIRTLHHHS